MRRWAALAALTILLVTCASPASAGESSDEGLDLGAQLNLWSVGASILVFLVLLWVLSKTAWRPILDGLQKREDTIKQALDDAEDAHQKAKALIEEYEVKIDQAREESREIFDEARRDAADVRAQIEADARKRADETVDRAKREIEQLTAKAWDSLVRDAAAIATQAAGRIIDRSLSPEGHADIVAGVVAEYAGKRAGGEAPKGNGSL